jgi:hypothetical protein
MMIALLGTRLVQAEIVMSLRIFDDILRIHDLALRQQRLEPLRRDRQPRHCAGMPMAEAMAAPTPVMPLSPQRL